jgi:hypothetical protein
MVESLRISGGGEAVAIGGEDLDPGGIGLGHCLVGTGDIGIERPPRGRQFFFHSGTIIRDITHQQGSTFAKPNQIGTTTSDVANID